MGPQPALNVYSRILPSKISRNITKSPARLYSGR